MALLLAAFSDDMQLQCRQIVQPAHSHAQKYSMVCNSYPCLLGFASCSHLESCKCLHLLCFVLLLLASQTHMIDVVASPSLVAQAAKIAVRHIVGYSSHDAGMSCLLTGHVQFPEVCTSCGLPLRTNPDQSGQMPVTWSALVWACNQKKAVAQVNSNGSLYMGNCSSQGNKGCERASASRTRPHDQCTWCVCAGASDT